MIYAAGIPFSHKCVKMDFLNATISRFSGNVGTPSGVRKSRKSKSVQYPILQERFGIRNPDARIAYRDFEAIWILKIKSDRSFILFGNFGGNSETDRIADVYGAREVPILSTKYQIVCDLRNGRLCIFLQKWDHMGSILRRNASAQNERFRTGLI